MLALLIVMAVPALSRIDPDLLLYRSRASRLLDSTTREALEALVQEGPETPEALSKLIATRFSRSAEHDLLVLYAGVALVEHRNEIAVEFERRIETLKLAQELLEDYAEEVDRSIRSASYGGEALKLPESGSFPCQAVKTAEGIEILRPLPKPQRGLGRSGLNILRDAARHDLIRVKERLLKASRAQANYHFNTSDWLDHLRQVAGSDPRLQQE